jgi:hypothetical protein
MNEDQSSSLNPRNTLARRVCSREFSDRFVRNGSQEQQRCRCCQNVWSASSWNFYGLCDACFPRWCDVRVKIPPDGAYSHVTPSNGYYVSCDAWIEDGCPDAPKEPFVIHWNKGQDE